MTTKYYSDITEGDKETVIQMYKDAKVEPETNHETIQDSNIVMLKTPLNHSNINTTALYVENDDETLASIVKNVGVR